MTPRTHVQGFRLSINSEQRGVRVHEEKVQAAIMARASMPASMLNSVGLIAENRGGFGPWRFTVPESYAANLAPIGTVMTVSSVDGKKVVLRVLPWQDDDQPRRGQKREASKPYKLHVELPSAVVMPPPGFNGVVKKSDWVTAHRHGFLAEAKRLDIQSAEITMTLGGIRDASGRGTALTNKAVLSFGTVKYRMPKVVPERTRFSEYNWADLRSKGISYQIRIGGKVLEKKYKAKVEYANAAIMNMAAIKKGCFHSLTATCNCKSDAAETRARAVAGRKARQQGGRVRRKKPERTAVQLIQDAEREMGMRE